VAASYHQGGTIGYCCDGRHRQSGVQLEPASPVTESLAWTTGMNPLQLQLAHHRIRSTFFFIYQLLRGRTMKTLILSIALIAFTFVSCSDTQAPTSSQNSGIASFDKALVLKELPFEACPFQPCPDCDECVCITGTFQIVDNGNNFTLVAKGEGYGMDCVTGEPTGTTYKWHDVINVKANGAFNQSWHVTSNDGGCDFKLHVTVNSNGELTVENVECD
jgi:hypothetical protein